MLLTVKEAAEELRLSETTIRSLCAKRKLRHERHGVGRGKILIPDDAITEYRQGATVGVGQAAVAAPRRRAPQLTNLRLPS